MAPGLPSATVHLAEIFVECVLYGLNLITFFACLQSLFWAGPGKTGWSRFVTNWFMITITLLLFFISSTNLALVFSRLIQGITFGIRDHNDTQFGKDWVNIAKDVTGFLQVFIADIVLIYRCWVMYAYSRTVIVFPVLMWLGGTVCMALEIWSSISSNDFGTRPDDKRFAFDTGFWASTICLNLYATFGIILRIYNVEKANLKPEGGLASALRQKPSRLQIAMCIINESAFMHTAATIVYFITLEMRDASANVTWAAQIQIIGITFNLIIIRSSRHGEEKTITESTPMSTSFRFNHGTAPEGEVQFPSFVTGEERLGDPQGKHKTENSSLENISQSTSSNV